MNNTAKQVIAIEAIVIGILVASIMFLVVSYETPEEKIEVKEISAQYTDEQYELLSEITDYYIAYGLHGSDINDPEWECVKWKGILTFVNLKYPQLTNQTQGMVNHVCNDKEIKFPVNYTQKIIPSEILDQEFTITVSQNLEGDELTIYGTLTKSHFNVSGTIYAGNLDDLRIVHAFSITSDKNGEYKQIIDTPAYDPKWQEKEYTVSVKSGKEQKQLRFTR